MTTPTTAKVGHESQERTVAEIDGFRGRLISADHPDYDGARAIWNSAIDRRPSLIARCSGTADVIAAVRFARDHDLEIAVRGGGHGVGRHRQLRRRDRDRPVTDAGRACGSRGSQAWVQGGALWGDDNH